MRAELAAASKPKSSSPISILSPCTSVRVVMRAPFTSVPLPLPRSWSTSPVASKRISACRRDARVLWITTVQSADRPKLIPAVPMGNERPAEGPRTPTICELICAASAPQAKRNASSPISITSPGPSGRAVTRCPLTRVPLALPRSRTITPPGSMRISAWRREAETLPIGIVASGVRPSHTT
jgi:hypothetical protein